MAENGRALRCGTSGALAWTLPLVLAACGYDARLGERCPAEAPDCRRRVILSDADGGERTPAVPPPKAHLGLALLDRDQQPLHASRLGCGSPCIEVTAVAEGGEPPYAFTWSDGAQGAERRLCPTSAATYTVEVSDSAPNPHSERASLMVDVEPCARDDAGSAGAPATPRQCEPIMLWLANGCTGGMGVPGAPRLQPGQPYTVRVRGSLTADTGIQLYGYTIVCVGSALSSFKLPVGQTEASLCLVPPEGVEWVALVPYSNAIEVLGNALSAELCIGCE